MHQGLRVVTTRPASRRARQAFAWCLLLTLAGRAEAQSSAGTASAIPPGEAAYVYKQVPDVPVLRAGAEMTRLSALWQDKPVLLVMVFSRCAGTCSPFLRSLKSAVSDAGGAGSVYRIVVLSFDEADTAADIEAMGANAGIRPDTGWVFGIAPPSDIRRLAEATGFWFRWDQVMEQYDHPSMVVAIDRGRVLRMLVGATVSGTQLSEIVQEFGGKFVPAYALPGQLAFRCFEYDPTSGRYSLDWGLLLLMLPGGFAVAATMSVFYGASSSRVDRSTDEETRSPVVGVGSLIRRRRAQWTAVLADYWTLTKPEVNLLIVITTVAGFWLSSPLLPSPFLRLFHTIVGTMLVASGTGALNQYIERRFDGQMRRTALRPLPAGKIVPFGAVCFGVLLSVAGGLYLAILVNVLASALAILTLTTYLFIYTPLKRKTPLCTLVGAVPGAVPPLIGWAGARGSLDLDAWTLYAIVFFWQFPHFMAIAWMYREDYARAGYLTLPRGKRQSPFMAWQTMICSVALLVVSLIPTFGREASLGYSIGALVFGLGVLYCAARLVSVRSNASARRLLLASILYLPAVLLLMGIDNALR